MNKGYHRKREKARKRFLQKRTKYDKSL